MKEILLFGRDAFLEYVNDGVGFAFVAFSLIYLGWQLFYKKKNKLITTQKLIVKTMGVVLLLLLCPGISMLISRWIVDSNTFSPFQIIPTGLIIGMAAAELYEYLENDGSSRAKKIGFFVGGAALFAIGLTSPFYLTTDHLSLISNAEKVPKEIYDIVENTRDGIVLLPEKYAAGMGEASPVTIFYSTKDTGTDERSVESYVSAGHTQGLRYIVVDKTKLTSEENETLDETLANENLSVVLAEKEYAIYEQGVSYELTQYSDLSGNQAMFYTIRNRDTGELIVIDGGWTENADQVRQVICDLGGHVTAWILTHFHEDHAGAFNVIYGDPQGILIDDIYVSAYDSAYDDFLSNHKEWDNPETFALYMEQTAGGTAENIHHPKRGEEMDIAGLHFKFYNTYDETLLSLYQSDLPNNCGLVFKVTGSHDSILFMGDMYAPEVGQWMLDNYGEELQTEYINLCHHGNSIMPTSFYEGVGAKTLLFDSPEWLINSEDHQAKPLAEWADERGIARYDQATAPNRFYFW